MREEFLLSQIYPVFLPTCRPGHGPVSGVNLTWEQVRNADSQAPPRSPEAEAF